MGVLTMTHKLARYILMHAACGKRYPHATMTVLHPHHTSGYMYVTIVHHMVHIVCAMPH